MKDNLYTLLNEMDHQPDAYGHFEASPADVREWRKKLTGNGEKSSRSRTKYIAAAACICLLATAVSPAGQTVYAKINEFAYSLSELLGISKDLSPYNTVVGESISKNGITVTLNDVILDDETLLVSYTTTAEKALKDDSLLAAYLGSVSIFIDGRQISVGSSGDVEQVDEHTLVSCLNVEMPDIDPSRQIDMEIRFNVNDCNIGSISFTTSGKELLADTAVIDLDQTFTLPDGSKVTLTKYTSSSVNQKIYFELSQSGYLYDLMLKGSDDLGNEVEFTVRSVLDKEGRMEVSTLNNGYINEAASELTLALYAVEMPQENGQMSNDYEQIGDTFSIPLDAVKDIQQ